MKRRIRYLAGVVAAAGLLVVVTAAGAETCKLEIKKVNSSSRVFNRQDYMFRATYPQGFFMQLGGPQGMVRQPGDKGKPEFSKLIKKEPAKYVTEHPFRGIAKLGSQYYGFVFDSAPPKETTKKKEVEKKKESDKKQSKTEAKTKAKKPESPSKEKPKVKLITYSRLYFDLNHNGDLTDDKVIEAESSRTYAKNYTHSTFPRADLTIEVDGAKIDYSFTMRVNTNTSSSYSYANASLNAAAYREGEVTLDGKKHRIVVIDFNSNGKFNDVSTINNNIRTHDGAVYPTQGDRLYIIDSKSGPLSGSPYDVSGSDALHYVGKMVNLGGKYHDLTITPSGNELTLVPSSIPIGYVTNPNKGYRAVVYGEKGFLKVVGDESGKSPLPEGEWKLLSYTINHTPKPKPKKPKADAKDKTKAKSRSMLSIFKDAIAATIPSSPSAAVSPSRSALSTVAAQAKKDYKAVKVVKGKTVALPFGPPYRPVVKAQYPQGDRKVSLGMSLVGVADEVCNNLTVNGARPGKPQFTISTKDAKEVQSGAFEYG